MWCLIFQTTSLPLAIFFSTKYQSLKCHNFNYTYINQLFSPKSSMRGCDNVSQFYCELIPICRLFISMNILLSLPTCLLSFMLLILVWNNITSWLKWWMVMWFQFNKRHRLVLQVMFKFLLQCWPKIVLISTNSSAYKTCNWNKYGPDA